jgi:hypothetical protein
LSFFPALILLDSLTVLFWVILCIASVGLLGVLAHQFLIPLLRLKQLELPDPVAKGDQFDIVVDEGTRTFRFTIGKKTGNLRTLCHAISEDHLVFQFKKTSDNEEYTITVQKNAPVLFKPPRMDVYSKMESKEKIESHEIIGHTADFRISDRFTKDRMVNYIEIRLGSSFYFNKMGKERMRFSFTIARIQPGLNREFRNRDGCFDWGQEDGAEEEEDENISSTTN